MDLSELKKPFPASKIKWRVGRKTKDKLKAIPFAYIVARDVMDRLDEVCGIDSWQAEYPFPGCCRIGVRVSLDNGSLQEWVWKTNGVGNVHYGLNDTPETKEMKDKGQYSDAFKRAGVLWGIADYLYDLPNVWLPVGQYGFEDEVLADLNNRYESWVKKYFE